jgi:TM2 domain-containing membrane protein YozV
MTAAGFGRKGVAGGAVAPRRANLVASQQPRSFQPMRDVANPGEDSETRRAAFLAEERDRDAPSEAPDALPTAETEKALASLKAESVLVPTDRSLKAAYALWFFLGLAGGHRFYLRRPVTGAIQTLLFIGCVGAVAVFQYYEAFAGLALSWLWFLADGIRLRRLHTYSGPR